MGLCHFRHSHSTPAFSSSGGNGGKGTLQEVKRSTTSLNSLETQEETCIGEDKSRKRTTNGQWAGYRHLWRDLLILDLRRPHTHVVLCCKAKGVSWSWRKLGHSVLLLWSIVALFKNPCSLPLQKTKSSLLIPDFRQSGRKSVFLKNKMLFWSKVDNYLPYNIVKMITIINSYNMAKTMMLRTIK